MRILVVDDESAVREAVERALRIDGYEVAVAGDGREALEALEERAPDAVVLDVLMPRVNGLDVCRWLRDRGDRTPVLMLTARDAVVDRVAGLDAGADDYLVKPFALEELVARLEALLRRPGQLLGRSLQVANLALDTESRQAFIDDKPHVLSARETAVLELLMRRKDRVVSKKHVEDQIFGMSGEVASNAVEVYVHRLRKQLSERGAKVQIHTIRGVGYLIAEEKAG
jgi:DNA-binding response OmpR family regulator